MSPGAQEILSAIAALVSRKGGLEVAGKLSWKGQAGLEYDILKK